MSVDTTAKLMAKKIKGRKEETCPTNARSVCVVSWDMHVPKSDGRSSTTTEVATLSDFDLVYRGGGRYGSRFDTLDGLDVSRVCASAGVAARAWWARCAGRASPPPVS